ncbi:hypothetical protein EI94DRAFT_1705551 [Lactarius quietus]|nr:hypothetical protein EI94DRAFT_1705551 [Lactarius quietus]
MSHLQANDTHTFLHTTPHGQPRLVVWLTWWECHPEQSWSGYKYSISSSCHPHQVIVRGLEVVELCSVSSLHRRPLRTIRPPSPAVSMELQWESQWASPATPFGEEECRAGQEWLEVAELCSVPSLRCHPLRTISPPSPAISTELQWESQWAGPATPFNPDLTPLRLSSWGRGTWGRVGVAIEMHEICILRAYKTCVVLKIGLLQMVSFHHLEFIWVIHQCISCEALVKCLDGVFNLSLECHVVSLAFVLKLPFKGTPYRAVKLVQPNTQPKYLTFGPSTDHPVMRYKTDPVVEPPPKRARLRHKIDPELELPPKRVRYRRKFDSNHHHLQDEDNNVEMAEIVLNVGLSGSILPGLVGSQNRVARFEQRIPGNREVVHKYLWSIACQCSLATDQALDSLNGRRERHFISPDKKPRILNKNWMCDKNLNVKRRTLALEMTFRYLLKDKLKLIQEKEPGVASPMDLEEPQRTDAVLFFSDPPAIEPPELEQKTDAADQNSNIEVAGCRATNDRGTVLINESQELRQPSEPGSAVTMKHISSATTTFGKIDDGVIAMREKLNNMKGLTAQEVHSPSNSFHTELNLLNPMFTAPSLVDFSKVNVETNNSCYEAEAKEVKTLLDTLEDTIANLCDNFPKVCNQQVCNTKQPLTEVILIAEKLSFKSYDRLSQHTIGKMLVRASDGVKEFQKREEKEMDHIMNLMK